MFFVMTMYKDSRPAAAGAAEADVGELCEWSDNLNLLFSSCNSRILPLNLSWKIHHNMSLFHKVPT